MENGDHKGGRQEDITRLLHDWRGGSEQARDALMPLVYDVLHRLANQQFSRERSDHTLQPTALVHEAFLNLDGSSVDWQDRNHFYAVAARMMRRVLVDHARGRSRSKRGGDRIRVDLATADIRSPAPEADLLVLDEALTRLAEHSERTVRILELAYFGGLTREAVADVLGISSRTVDRDLKLGRAWLRNQLQVHD